MALYACVRNFSFATVAATPYTQVVAGVSDIQTGTPFEGHTFIFLNTTTTLNNFGPPPASQGGTLYNVGLARSATSGAAAGNGDILFVASTKVNSGCGLGRYSLCTNGPSGFFGGSIIDAGYLSAITAGTFTITWDIRTNIGFLPDCTALILGGDGWNIDISTLTWNVVNTTTAAPQGVLVIPQLSRYSSSLTSAVGAGGADEGISWATIDGIYGSASYRVADDNARIQLHDRVNVALTPGTPPTQDSGVPIVSDWGATSWTGAGSGGSAGSLAHAALAFSGTGIICKAGTFDVTATDGSLSVNLGLDPMFVIFASVGMADTTSPDGTQASVAIGWTDRLNFGSVWTAENSPKFPSPAVLNGSNYLSDAILTMSAVPDRDTTVPANLMSIAPITGHDGFIQALFTDTDGTAPNIVWFAVGVAVTPIPPPPEPDRRVIRRLRQFAHLNQTNLLTFIDNVELYIQSGTGNDDVADPQMMFQYSKDGGETWSRERWVSAGKIGEYEKRLRWLQLGQGRDWVFRFVASDPAIWNLAECFATVRQGTS